MLPGADPHCVRAPVARTPEAPCLALHSVGLTVYATGLNRCTVALVFRARTPRQQPLPPPPQGAAAICVDGAPAILLPVLWVQAARQLVHCEILQHVYMALHLCCFPAECVDLRCDVAMISWDRRVPVRCGHGVG